MKLIVKAFVTLSVTSVLFTSCMTTKTSVGTYKEAPGKEYVYAKSKQVWLFWGIAPLGRTNTSTPANGQCEVISRINGIDLVISAITGGIVTSKTIKVKAKKVETTQIPVVVNN